MPNELCNQFIDVMFDDIDGVLPAKSSAALHAHMETCAECRLEYEQRAETIRLICECKMEPHSNLIAAIMGGIMAAGTEKKRSRQLFRSLSTIAACIAVVTVIAGSSLIGGYFLRKDSSTATQAEDVTMNMASLNNEDAAMRSIREEAVDEIENDIEIENTDESAVLYSNGSGNDMGTGAMTEEETPPANLALFASPEQREETASTSDDTPFEAMATNSVVDECTSQYAPAYIGEVGCVYLTQTPNAFTLDMTPVDTIEEETYTAFLYDNTPASNVEFIAFTLLSNTIEYEFYNDSPSESNSQAYILYVNIVDAES